MSRKKKRRLPKKHHGKAVFTVDLRALRADLDADIEALRMLQQQIERKRKKLAAAELLAPETEQEDIAREKPRVQRRQRQDQPEASWPDAIMDIINTKTGGIAHQDLLKEAAERFRLPISKGAKGFYNAIKRLHDAEKIVKRGGLLYTPAVVQALERSGTPLPQRQVDRGGSVSIVLSVLKDYPQGLPAMKVKELVGQHPDAPRSITHHNHYIYNVLGSLEKRGRITRSGGLYKLAEPQAVQPALH